MDIRWKNNTKLIGWLLLFTFGLGGVHPLILNGYYGYPSLMYVYISCGIAALTACAFTVKKVEVFETLRDGPWQEWYNRVPFDIRAFAAFIFLMMSLVKIGEIAPGAPFNGVYFAQSLVVTTILVTLTLVQVLFMADVLRDKDARTLAWQESILHRFASAFRESFFFRHTGFQLFWTLLVFFASGFGLMVVFLYHGAVVLYVPLLLIVTVPTLYAVSRKTGDLNRMAATASEIVEGYTVPDLPVKGRSPHAKLAESINRMKHGVELSQAAQAKSERFKTDLITNVSHDLRTPLTSIITYTELLKKPDLNDEDKAQYIEVIDQKSQRLKALIDDLFEASKMASGNVELKKERVDIAQLLQQALAERDEAVSASELDFRITKTAEPIYCVVDGQKMWRVFDNLIGNILKYSLEHTRVYLSIEQGPAMTTLTFKNVSRYELNGDIDELFERFKRGDESRHTEGSGLGLAIAKSIVDLHDGSLDIHIDGDLFKAVITLPNER
ncbi:sensor histidine kinase [Alicyclobacillus ferrooxydans]|uniref:sensor histidine kinase n=1 Tax=Alicyclobacillus ferrooxydans TaxID=471514 RepID=UPI0006D52E8B|nr:HAMP domain-containing sensor histidine kinase [Alicyclobacillus ferrooxydans]